MGRWGRPVQNQSKKKKNLRLKKNRKTQMSDINQGIKKEKKYKSVVVNLHTLLPNLN